MTTEQRRQIIDFTRGGAGMPIPTGNLQASQRAHICSMYYEVFVPSPLYYWTNRIPSSGSWNKKVVVSSAWKNRETVSGTPWTERIPPPDNATLKE